MLSVGIDVSKGKSTVCLMRPFGEIVAGPMEITHVDSELKTLVKLMKSMNDEVKVIKEAEGKPKKVAKMAGLNKFLRIYYARVMVVYNC